MQIKSLLCLLFTSCFALTSFAAEPVAKEDTTPPLPEGALTASQIPPIHSLSKPIMKPSQQPNTSDSTAPATTIETTSPNNLSRPSDTNVPPTLNAPIANPPSLPNTTTPRDQVIPVQ